MIANNIVPAHILRLYMWELLKANTSMGLVDTLIPIVPIEDEPRLTDSGKTYLVYGYAENESSGQKEIKRGMFTVRVVAKTFAELTQVLNIISRGFENEDRTAENINIYSSLNTQLRGIRFTSVCTSYVEGGNPSDSEGGNIEGIVGISYNYVTNLKVTLPVQSGLWS